VRYHGAQLLDRHFRGVGQPKPQFGTPRCRPLDDGVRDRPEPDTRRSLNAEFFGDFSDQGVQLWQVVRSHWMQVTWVRLWIGRIRRVNEERR